MNGKNNNYNPLRQTLHDVEETKRNLNYEVGTLFSRDGRLIKEYGGEAYRVRIPVADHHLFEGNIFTHNHPSGRTFTQEDIVEFADSGLFEARATTPQGIYFSLRENAEEVNRSIGRVMQAEEVGSYDKANYIFNQQIDETDIELSLIERNNRVYDIMSEEVEKWLSDNAEEFGYIYTKGEI